ncbi:hypothetical protein [Clostridium botulinum]|uniref:hypothetical protein n=1 Tax=Clostridium botulinum TaxID=1491 RepID=UPI0004D749F8|nr:hypothetical protein [Clostridium botulinum]KEH90637.1 hypothetical protein Z963_12080 [Clostridium botulinum C/D str. It1]
MARKITISFKETKKDLELYNTLMAMEDKSCEIKHLIRRSLKNDTAYKNIDKKADDENIEEVNILDF